MCVVKMMAFSHHHRAAIVTKSTGRNIASTATKTGQGRSISTIQRGGRRAEEEEEEEEIVS